VEAAVRPAGLEKRPEQDGGQVIWPVVAHRSTKKRLYKWGVL